MPKFGENLSAIGGPSLLVRHQFLLFGIPTVIAISLIFTPAPTPSTIGTRLLVGFLLLAVVWVLAEAAKVTVFRARHQTPVHATFVFIFGAAMGVVVLLVGHVAERLLGAVPASLTPLTLLTAMLLGGVAIVAMSLIEIARNNYRTRQRLQLEAEQSATTPTQLIGGVSAVFDELSATVSDQLAKSTGNLAAFEASDKAIAECIKPLMARGFTRRSWADRYLILRGATRDSVVLRPFELPFVAAALYFIGLIGSNLFLAPDRMAAVIPAAIIDFIILAAGLRIAQNFFQKSLLMRGWLAIASYLGVLTTLSVVVVLVNQYLLLGGPTLLTLAISIPQNLVILMLFTLVISIVSLLRLPPTSQQAGSDLWQTDISMGGSISRAVDSLVKRRLAQHLHSTVQNRVLALKMGYVAGEQFNPGEIEERVLSIIAEAQTEFIEQQSTTLEDRMGQLQVEWAPVLTMHFVNSTVNLTLVQQTLFFLVIQECVTNSVRHGLATEVSASLERWPPADPNNFRLRVSDNGVGPVGKKRKEGVGMRFVDELSGGSYDLGFGVNGGATLEALIRC